jgi:hypothetical protein
MISQMKFRALSLLVSLLTALALATPVFATTATIQYVSPVDSGAVYNGFYAGVYNGLLNGSAAKFICDDYLHDIGPNHPWTANVNSNNPATGDRFDPSTVTNPLLLKNPNNEYSGSSLTSQLEEYNMITWLVEQMLGDPSDSHKEWAALSGAIWSTTDTAWGTWNSSTKYTYNAAYTTKGGLGLSAQQYVQSALSHKDDTNLPKYTVYTPTGGYGQEFFGAPEASTTLFLGLSVLSSGLLRKRLFD